MKRLTNLALFVFVLFLSNQTNAQKLITVQNGGTPKFYSLITEALANAMNKDTIYIPGGAYTFNTPLIIDKELHVIGNGHYPDSTKVGGITLLNTSITLISGANNSTFEGLSFSYMYSGNSPANEDVDNIIVSRCNLGSLSLSRLSTNWVIKENVVQGDIYGRYQSETSLNAQNNVFSNNILNGIFKQFGPNNLIKNNVFLQSAYNGVYGGYYSSFADADGCLFENNVFLMGGMNYIGNISSCTFNNNIFIFNFLVPSNSLGNNNLISQTTDNIFINQTANSFNYTHDYHLKPDSYGKNAGRDGTDIGIYGGAFPWKEGSIPFNPHFQAATIAPKTDNTGNLNIQIKVSAQDN